MLLTQRVPLFTYEQREEIKLNARKILKDESKTLNTRVIVAINLIQTYWSRSVQNEPAITPDLHTYARHYLTTYFDEIRNNYGCELAQALRKQFPKVERSRIQTGFTDWTRINT
jgi:hypothetical protein